MLTLLSGQPADVTVGGLDHGVEVVGVAAVDLASFQPGQKDAHRFWKLAIIWPKPEDREKEESRNKWNPAQSLEGGRNNREEDKNDAQGTSCINLYNKAWYPRAEQILISKYNINTGRFK